MVGKTSFQPSKEQETEVTPLGRSLKAGLVFYIFYVDIGLFYLLKSRLLSAVYNSFFKNQAT